MITSALNKEFGGPPVAVTEAACALSELGADLTVAIFGQTLENFRNNSFDIRLNKSLVKTEFYESKHTSQYGGLPRLSELPKFWQTLKNADVVTLHQIYNFQNILSFLAMMILNKKYVVMPHGSLTTYQKSQHRWRKKLVNFFFVNMLLNMATAIFVATLTEKNEINSKFQTKTQIVGLGIVRNLQLLSKEKKINRNFTFVYMGRLTGKKRIDIAINSLILASKLSSRDITFIICGKGDFAIEKEILNFSRSPGLLHIDYRGWVDGEEKIEVLSKADAFILTSEDENFAIAVAEGLGFGLPCLISKNVALSSLVSKYSAGIVFEILDIKTIACEALNLMNSDILQISQNAINASKELHWDFIAKKWADELLKIVYQT